jgi:hypothetical protein
VVESSGDGGDLGAGEALRKMPTANCPCVGLKCFYRFFFFPCPQELAGKTGAPYVEVLGFSTGPSPADLGGWERERESE